MQLKIDKIPVPIFKFKLHWHDDIKKTVLPMIRENDGKTQTDKPADNISKLDFDDSHDMKRPWVLKILPMIQSELNQMIARIDQPRITIKQIWYQTYDKDGEHGWHTHGCNFTGIYYIDFDKNIHPRTEIKFPFEPNLHKVFDVSEGDILMFPSFFTLRAPKNTSEVPKTIISWNADCY